MPIPSARISFILPQTLSFSLIELFFDKIHPWLPMLHRPRFLARYQDRLNSKSHFWEDLPVDEALLLYSMFALSARFSSSDFFGDVAPIERGSRFLPEAKALYEQARAIVAPTLTYLQGCIALAFYYYTSEPCPQSWILTGVCVRIAYELDLADIDADETQNVTLEEWVKKKCGEHGGSSGSLIHSDQPCQIGRTPSIGAEWPSCFRRQTKPGSQRRRNHQ